MTDNFLPPPRERSGESTAFDFPGTRDRVTVNGMTGSGKSTFALWLVAESADFHRKPWIIIDYKREDIVVAALKEGLFKPLAVNAKLPRKPGMYVVQPDAKAGPGPVVELLWNVYDQGSIGLFLDEATMIPELRGEANSGGPFQSILSQGRSKVIPTYVLCQRPVHVNNMVFTENNFYCAFRLRGSKDLDKVTDYIPERSRDFKRVWSDDIVLPKYHSRWYDAQQDRSFILRPSPNADKILDVYAHRIDLAAKKGSI
jgi:hypothetical protein